MRTIRVRRYNPEISKKAYWEDFAVPAEPSDRILDVLKRIKDDFDGSLTFRSSCGHGICGSDALRINGLNRLACQTLVGELPAKKPITIEPIKGLPTIKDLVVDQEPFFAAYRKILPYLIPDPVVPSAPLSDFDGVVDDAAAAVGDPAGFAGGAGEAGERLQTPAQLARYDETTKCILCAACTSSCPIFWVDGTYLGPAAIVNAHRFIFDSRDGAAAERLQILDSKEGVWRCRTAYNCTDACPRDIPVTKAIGEVKRAILRSG
jgi:succinate dehydrogenase / fumarate reductase iron-sulfur subunit